MYLFYCWDVQKMTEFFSGFLTPVIAIITVVILILQYILANRRWRLDLYDKRYPVYIATMEYISSIMQDGNVTDEKLFKFLRNSKDKEFLFGKDIQDYLKLLYDRGADMIYVKMMLENIPIGEERERIGNQSHDLLMWFKSQFEISKKLFGEYLKIDKK